MTYPLKRVYLCFLLPLTQVCLIIVGNKLLYTASQNLPSKCLDSIGSAFDSHLEKDSRDTFIVHRTTFEGPATDQSWVHSQKKRPFHRGAWQ